MSRSTTITFIGERPAYGTVTCDECGLKIEVNPEPVPTDPLAFAGAAELDAGAAKIREMVEPNKRSAM